LRLGQIDAGFIIPPLPETLVPELSYLALMREPLLLALPSALAAHYPERPIALSRLREQRLIIFPRHLAPALYDHILTCFAAAGITPYIVQEAIQMHTIVNLVAAQMGMALVPESVANLQRLGVEYLPLLDASPVLETGLAWRSEHASPVLAAFLALLKPSQ
jgi:DNA-binding transcriptional LysR family regulator